MVFIKRNSSHKLWANGKRNVEKWGAILRKKRPYLELFLSTFFRIRTGNGEIQSSSVSDEKKAVYQQYYDCVMPSNL